MNQKEAVFQVVKEIKRGAVDKDEPVMLSKQEKQLASQKLYEGFKKGRIAYNGEMPSDDKLLLYISGLVSNWLRKDKRLNGHTNYVPGRRSAHSAATIAVQGNADPKQMEALRQLAAIGTGTGDEEIRVFVIRRPAQQNAQQQQQQEQQEEEHAPY